MFAQPTSTSTSTSTSNAADVTICDLRSQILRLVLESVGIGLDLDYWTRP